MRMYLWLLGFYVSSRSTSASRTVSSRCRIIILTCILITTSHKYSSYSLPSPHNLPLNHLSLPLPPSHHYHISYMYAPFITTMDCFQHVHVYTCTHICIHVLRYMYTISYIHVYVYVHHMYAYCLLHVHVDALTSFQRHHPLCIRAVSPRRGHHCC